MTRNLFANVDVFKGLDSSELKILESLAMEKDIPEGEVLFKEGDRGDKMYLILDGVVEIWKCEGKDLKGSRLARLSNGEIFGEMALFDHMPRSASAMAALSKDTRILVWEEKDLASLTKDHPKTGIKILTNILMKVSNRLRIANDAIHTLLRSNQYIGL